MSKPWKYVKDARCFTIHLPNFAEIARAAEYEEYLDMPETVGNREITFAILKPNGFDYLHVAFTHMIPAEDDEIAAASMVFCFYTDKKSFPVTYKELDTDSFWHLDPLNINDILGSGYLVNGVLKIHVEIRIDCLIRKDGIRKFNFFDPVSDWLKIQGAAWDFPFYTPKQPFLHHCKQLDGKDIADGSTITIANRALPAYSCEMFLQRVNGVMITIDCPFVFCVAYHLGAHLPLRLGEPNDFGKECAALWYIFPNNMGLFKKTVENIKNIEDLKKFVRDCKDEGKMTGEHLKTIVKKFFSFA